MDGIIVVNKEKGFTSFDVVAKLRGIIKMKKIGHTGTLDPDATGVLPVCLGSGTKICDMLTDSKKEYVAEFTLGMTSDTQDIWGTILSEKPVFCTKEEFLKVAESFVGDIWQVPPMYSAIKVNGKRLYELAREGKEVERKARPVSVYEIELQSFELPKVKLRISCSKGTYIRTIAHDIGQKLGCGAVMSALQRTKASGFTIEEAYTLSEIEEIFRNGNIDSLIHPIREVFSELESIYVLKEYEGRADNGNKLSPDMLKGGSIILGEVLCKRNDEFLYGIYQYDETQKLYIPVKLFFC